MSDIKVTPVKLGDLTLRHKCGEELHPGWYLSGEGKEVYAHCRACQQNIILQRKRPWVKREDGTYGYSVTGFDFPDVYLTLPESPK